jgi:hypothetical protein
MHDDGSRTRRELKKNSIVVGIDGMQTVPNSTKSVPRAVGKRHRWAFVIGA